MQDSLNHLSPRSSTLTGASLDLANDQNQIRSGHRSRRGPCALCGIIKVLVSRAVHCSTHSGVDQAEDGYEKKICKYYREKSLAKGILHNTGAIQKSVADLPVNLLRVRTAKFGTRALCHGAGFCCSNNSNHLM